MADFNAFPALDIQPAKLSPGVDLASAFKDAGAIQAQRNQNALFPLQQQAMEQQNQINAFALEHAKQADQYGKVAQALQSIDDDSPDAPKQFDAAMAALGPEGKQWVGKYTLDNKAKAMQLYGGQAQQAATKAKVAGAVASKIADGLPMSNGAPNAFGGGESLSGGGPSASQEAWAGGLTPDKIQAIMPKINYAAQEADELAKSNDPAKKWKELQEKDPAFKAQHPGDYNVSDARQIIQNARAAKQWFNNLSSNAQSGIPNPREALTPETPGGGVFGVFDKYNYDSPFKQIYQAPESAADKEKNKIEWFKANTERMKVNNENSASAPDSADSYASLIDHQDMTIAQVPVKVRPAVAKIMNEQYVKGSDGVPGTTGAPEFDITRDGYTTKPVLGAGGLTQASIDSGATYFATNAKLPPGMGLGSTGQAGQRKTAIENRASEIDPGGNLAKNAALASAYTKTLGQQVSYASTVDRSLSAADQGLKQLTDVFKGKVNNYDMPIANVIANAAQYQLSPGDIAAMRAGLTEVRNEYQQVFARGGQVSDKVRDAADKILPGDLSMKDLATVHKELQAQGNIIKNSALDEAKKAQSGINDIIAGKVKSTSGAALPDAAKAKLQEGHNTTFGNGQTWTLRNGQPVQVQ